ncbi:MAG: hypothetical protein RLY40_37 [Pseudomonadota bacterium]|jgi:ankyrin repeat protein
MNIFDAIESNNIKAITQYINKGETLDIKNKYLENTPLHFACLKGNLKIVSMLIKAGAKINIKNYISKKPITYAISENHIRIVKLLLKQGAIISHRDILACNEFHLRNDQKLLKLLCKKYLKQRNIKNKEKV